MLELNPPRGVGFIVRTAGFDPPRRELSRDLAYLLRLWEVIVRRIKKLPALVDIYEESEMIIRTIRDIFNADVDTISIDEKSAFERAPRVPPTGHAPLRQPPAISTRARSRFSTVTGWTRKSPRSISGKVPLKAGGSIVIDHTEALVAIDVSSGSFRAEIRRRRDRLPDEHPCRPGNRPPNPPPRPRRRDRQRLHRHAQGEAPPRRRAGASRRGNATWPHEILRTSPFGLIEMTRQRIRPGLKPSADTDCPAATARPW